MPERSPLSLEQGNGEDVSQGRRNLALTLLGALTTGALLKGCVQDGDESSSPGSYDSEDQLGLISQAILGSSGIFWFDTYARLAEAQGGSTATSTNIAIGTDPGIGGIFAWTADTTSSDNQGTIIVPTATPRTGCWKRVFSGNINVKWFGAKGNGTNSDGAAINAAIAYAGSLGGGCVYVPAGNYKISGNTVNLDKANVWLRGDGISSVLMYYDAGYALTMGSLSSSTLMGLKLSDIQILTNISIGDSGGGIKVSGCTRWRIDMVHINGSACPSTVPDGGLPSPCENASQRFGTGIRISDFSWIGTISGGRITNYNVGIRFRREDAASTTQVFNSNEVAGQLELAGNNFGMIVGHEDENETGSADVGSGLAIDNICVEGNFSGGIWVASGASIHIHGTYFEGNPEFHVRFGSEHNTARPRNSSLTRCFTIGSNVHVDLQRGYLITCERNSLNPLTQAQYAFRFAGSAVDHTQLVDNFANAAGAEFSGTGQNTCYRNHTTLSRAVDAAALPVLVETQKPATSGTPPITLRSHATTTSYADFKILALTTDSAGHGFLQMSGEGGNALRVYNNEASSGVTIQGTNGSLSVGSSSPPTLTNGMIYFSSMLRGLTQWTTPSSPPANSGHLYFHRNPTTGKGELCALFPTGAPQVIATEP